MSTNSPSRFRIAVPLAIILLGFALRLAPWGENRFLEDEALYAYWGLQIASGADPRLDLEPLDKPPLFLYVLSMSQSLVANSSGRPVFGATMTGAPASTHPAALARQELTLPSISRWVQWYETAARLPSLFASTLSIALLYALGNRLFGCWRVGAAAALLLALSPFDILFASTAFTDPLMTVLVLGALLAAGTGRFGVSGLLSGLALATKQQALLFLPLVVAVALTARPRHRGGWKAWLRFVAAFAAVIGLVLWWDQLRLQRPGFVEQGFISYGGLGPAQPEALLERALAWLELLGNFWVSEIFNLLVLAVLGAWLLGSLLVARRDGGSRLTVAPFPDHPGTRGSQARLSALDLCFLVFVLAYLAMHWLLGFQLWDRYLLGLVPLAALLAARALDGLAWLIPSLRWRRAYLVVLGPILAASLVLPLLRASRSELALGGDHGAYDGIDEMAAYLRTEIPADSVLYHYWLGYHYRFYLYGAPLRTHWYPTVVDLGADAYVYRNESRYIAFPSWKDGAPAHRALADAGISLLPVMEATRRDGSVSFRLYRLDGP